VIARSRWLVPLAVALATASSAPLARAESSATAQCLEAHRDAQELRHAGKLLEARRNLVACAGAVCPGLVQKDCTKWLDDISHMIPSIVVSAKDEGGHELANVKVSIGDRVLAMRLDGTPIELDPGAYEFTFTRPHATPITKQILLETGVRNKLIEIDFPGGKVVKPKPKPPVIAWVLAGTGAVALTTFTIFGLEGVGKYNSLHDQCGNACSPSSTQGVKNDFLAADISLGVAAASLAASAYFFFIYKPPAPKAEQSRAGFSVGMAPLEHGAFATLGARF
jgi:hypothetical protein